MVRFKMIANKIIKFSAIKTVLDIFEIISRDRPIDSVKYASFLFYQNVGVVGNAVRNRVHIFKKMRPMVICAYPIQVVSNFSHVIHIFLLLIKICTRSVFFAYRRHDAEIAP